MNKQILYFFLFILSLMSSNAIAQQAKEKVARLFRSQEILSLKMAYSNNELRSNKNESMYYPSVISYKLDSIWTDLEVKIRARGKFRREECYFVPVKMKIKKSNSKGTLFKGQKRLKLVVPCFISKDMNDNVIKEFIAYKLYEKISGYNFKTRLVDISLTEQRKQKTKEHAVKGILIEDDQSVAKRLNARIVNRSIHPLGQDNITSIQNAFFQYMIGNVDFSVEKSHNSKLFYIGKKIFPVPYDFDMNGFVDPSYETVSARPTNSFIINKITHRKYRGVKRDPKLIAQVRQEFLNNKNELLAIVQRYESAFKNKSEFVSAENYISVFFEIISNDDKFQKEIMGQMR